MKIKLVIECEGCNNQATFEAKRTYVVFEGKVYEDYSSIVDGIGKNEFFEASQGSEVIDIKCLRCGKKHELF